MASSDPKQMLQRTLTLSDGILIELRKISQAIEVQSKRLELQIGITGSQLVILQKVASGEEYSVGEIARDVNLSQGTVTGIIDRMEKRGLVTRTKSESDRRRVMVRITEQGRSMLDRALPLMQGPFNRRFDRLEGWKQSMILSALQQLSTIMQTDSTRR